MYGQPTCLSICPYMPTPHRLCPSLIARDRSLFTALLELFTDKNGRQSKATLFITSCTDSSLCCQIEQEKKDWTEKRLQTKRSWIAQDWSGCSTMKKTDGLKMDAMAFVSLLAMSWFVCLGKCISTLHYVVNIAKVSSLRCCYIYLSMISIISL